MALLTLEYFQVVANFDPTPLTVKSGETVTDRRGKFMRVDGTTSKAMLGNASAAGEAGGLGGAVGLGGIALSDEKYVGDSVTLFRYGLLDWGDALDGMDTGALIYLSDTDGTFADSVGTVTTAIAGKVYPVFEHDGTVKLLAFIDMR